MKGHYKNELGKRYGDFIVEEYTELRVPTNGCIIWKCRCKYCDSVSYYSGNSLRFDMAKHCQNCNSHQKGRTRWRV